MKNRLARLAPYLSVLACLLMIGPAAAADSGPTVFDLWPASVAANGPTRGPERVGTEGKGLGAAMNISRARIEVYKPEHPNGAAVIIMGGGGYFRIQIANESIPVAQWLSALGVTPVVLYYRLPVDGWKAVAPFQDGQRAVRVLREHAAALGIDPQKIGVIGLSAGGNLAAITATRFGDNSGGLLRAALKIAKPVGAITPQQGAETILYLASSPDVEGITGEYFYKCRLDTPADAARNDADARRLWAASVDIAGLGH